MSSHAQFPVLVSILQTMNRRTAVSVIARAFCNLGICSQSIMVLIFCRARTKNEKKHLQRASKAREKREAEEGADAVVPGMSAPADLLEKHNQFKLPHRSVPIQGVEKQFGVGKRAGLRPWNERCKLALSEKKFSWLVNQLQE